MAIGACQWSGVAIVMASTFFLLENPAKVSFAVTGASPISCCTLSANFFRILLSTSQTCEMRAALRFALSDER